jgi:ribosomal protein L11 methyltransferase
MDWIEVTIKTTAEGADIAAQVFYDVGVTGVVVEDPDAIPPGTVRMNAAGIILMIPCWNMEEEVLVKAYLSNDASFEENLPGLRKKSNGCSNLTMVWTWGRLSCELTNVKEEDWANNWKKYYKPLKVSDRIVIKPSWEQYESKDDELYWKWIREWLLAQAPMKPPLFVSMHWIKYLKWRNSCRYRLRHRCTGYFILIAWCRVSNCH